MRGPVPLACGPQRPPVRECRHLPVCPLHLSHGTATGGGQEGECSGGWGVASIHFIIHNSLQFTMLHAHCFGSTDLLSADCKLTVTKMDSEIKLIAMC